MKKQSKKCLNREKMILELGNRFINIPHQKINETFQDALAMIGTLTRSDRCYLDRYDFEQEATLNLYEWCRFGVPSEKEHSLSTSFDRFPDMVASHLSGKSFFVPHTDDLPSDSHLYQHLEAQKVRSMVTVPMMNGKECLGFVGFDAVWKPRHWTREEIGLLQMLAGLFTNAELRRRNDEILAEERRRLNALIETMPDTMIYFKNRAGHFVWINQAQARILGVEQPEQALGKSDRDFFTDEHARWAEEDEARVMNIGQPMLGKIEKIRFADGQEHWVSTTKIPTLDQQGNIVGTMGISRDINDLKMAEEALQEAEHMYRGIFENAPVAIFQATPEGRFTTVNPEYAKTTGYGSPEEMIIAITDIATQMYHHPHVREEYKRLLSEKGQVKNFEALLKKKDGSLFWASMDTIVRRDATGAITSYDGFLTDITFRKQAEERVWYLSFHDHLTGLYNRAFFEEESRRLGDSRDLPVAIIMADVNGLKLINDAFGHERGDELLIRFAQVLKQSCRKEDLISRWGGDEFIILLPRSQPAHVEEVIERLRDACREVTTGQLPLSVSVGYALKTGPATSIDQVIRGAEERMYRNKLAESRSIRHSIITSLEGSLRESTRETEAHAHRLRHLARGIGNALNLSEHDLSDLDLLARLHDLGKIAIPAAILDKPGSLTAQEWETIQTHPEIGYRIAQSTPDLHPIAEVILAHHERWDGAGYPQRLQGETIPLLARIIAIVDAFDVMTRGRPYRKSISIAAARQEIERSSGSQFDPRLVNIFLSLPDVQ